MANTVQLKRSAVAGRVPTTSDLALGEVGINTYDGKVYIKKNDGADAIVQVGGPGGSDTQVLFNDSGTIGGDAGLTYNKTTDALTAAGPITAASLIPTSATVPTNGVYLPAANTVGFATNSSVRLRIDSSGRIVSGPTTARANFNNSTFTAALQVEGASFDTSHVAITRSSADSFSSNLTLAKTRSVSLGGTTSVVADDVLGALHFEGADGSELVRGATVSASVDGTPGANSMPTRLIFSTTPAGGSSPSERLRVRSDGNVGLASVGAVNVSFYNQKALTGGVTAFGNFTLSTIQSDVTTTATGYATQFTTQAAAFTLDSINHFSAGQTTFGAGSSVTNQYGFVANSSLTGATNNFGFYSNIASSAGRWNFYANGTANNYFNGSIGIGTTSITEKLTVSGNVAANAVIPTSATVPTNGIYLPSGNTVGIATNSTERMRIRGDGNVAIGGTGAATVSFYNQAPITGGTQAYANYTFATVQSDVTDIAWGYRTSIATASAAFTLSQLRHYEANQSTIGGLSTITTQYGFFASSTLVGATDNNYGFFGAIASSAGRWNFYANGTAPNYFAGDIRTNTAVTQRSAPTNSNTSVTATASSLLDGLRTGTPAAAINLTLPTGANMDLAFQELQTNQAFEWSVINLAAATHAITVVQNTGHTVVGNMVVAANSSGRFLTRKTAADTFITYRIA